MGFSTLIDILGSIMIGGTILTILFKMVDSSVENHYLNSGELIVQSNLLSIVDLFEHDLRKIGYCKDWEKLPDPTIAILEATETSITFLTDVAPDTSNPMGDGFVDTLKYWIGSPTDSVVMSTPNPKDRILYRQINNRDPLSANLGLTQFKMEYFDALGNKILNLPSSPPLGIITMQIDITVENTAAYGDEAEKDVYTKDRSSFWRQIRQAAPSLSNR